MVKRDVNPPLLNRRDLLKWCAAGVVGGIVLGNPGITRSDDSQLQSKRPVPVAGQGRVVKVHLPGMRDKLFPHPDAAKLAVEKAVCTLAGESDPGRAWSRFISPSDRVGIKVNCLGTRLVSTMREVTFAIAESVREMGVKDANILIFDMFASNMMGGRYNQQPNRRKMRVLAHREAGYGKSWIKAGPARVKFSELLDWCTAVINVPPIKDHDLAGVTCTMKNMAFGTVEKPHVNHQEINEAIAHIWALEQIRSKVRINIVDGSTILYDGGPKANRRALVPHECIYASTDPVAMDAIAFQLIENLRAQNKLRTLAAVGRPVRYLAMAEEMGLGLADLPRIHLETITLPRFAAEFG